MIRSAIAIVLGGIVLAAGLNFQDRGVHNLKGIGQTPLSAFQPGDQADVN